MKYLLIALLLTQPVMAEMSAKEAHGIADNVNAAAAKDQLPALLKNAHSQIHDAAKRGSYTTSLNVTGVDEYIVTIIEQSLIDEGYSVFNTYSPSGSVILDIWWK